MGNQSLGETMAGSGLLVAGLKANIEKLKRRGLDEAFVSSIEGLSKTIGDLNAEQDVNTGLRLPLFTDRLFPLFNVYSESTTPLLMRSFIR